MVFGWRRAFCTSVPREADSSSAVRATGDDPEHDYGGKGNGGGGGTPKFGGRFGFFSSSSSNSSTPRLQSQTDLTPRLRCRTTSVNLPEKSASVPVSPKLHCKTTGSHGLFQWSSTPSSPRSPSAFSLLKSNLRLSTNRCGLCLQSVKRGRGVAIYTAECSHGFHFPCIASHVKLKGSLACPICGTMWKEMPVLSVNDQNQKHQFGEEEVEEETLREKLATTLMDDVIEKKITKSRKQHSFKPDLKIYDDDEPLPALTPKARFNPIPETDENCDEDSIEEFQGFHNNSSNSNSPVGVHAKNVDVRLLPEAAVISAGRNHETYAIVLKAKAPSMPAKSEGRAPIDVVTVVDVSRKMSTEKIQMMKRTMRLIISSLSSSDRLSIVAFSSYSKRLLPLKRMTTTGQRAARRIVDAMAVLEGSSNGIDAVRKAAKVLEDRREKNAAGSIILLSDVPDQSSHVSSTRYSHSHLDVALHTVKLAMNDDHTFAKSIGNLLNVVVKDLQLDFRFISGSPPAEITAVYSYTPKPVALGSGRIRIGELFADEERELLIEMKVLSSAMRVHQVLSVNCTYRESVTHEIIYCKENTLVLPVPNPTTLRSSVITIQRLRSLFVTTRAIAESRRLTARNDIIGAYHILISARALIHQTTSASALTNEFLTSLEAELNDLQRRRVVQAGRATIDTAAEPLTPTSAWRVAEKLAKVAIMRKSLNRVSDLHGFEDARF